MAGTAQGEALSIADWGLIDQQLQVCCDDDEFIERAASQKPNMIVRYFAGAYSYPRDWWIGIFWCLMARGLFGQTQQTRARVWGRDLTTIVQFGINNPTLTARMLGVYFRHKAETSPEFYGRLTLGSAFTNFASQGGLAGFRRNGLGTKVASASGNFILSTTGAGILSVKYHGTDILSVFESMMTGRYRTPVSSELYREIFRQAVESSEPVPEEQHDAIVAILEGVLSCLEDPERYTPSIGGRREVQVMPHMPVGQVSSMRPNGVSGMIPAGHETNALDVIGDRWRW